MLWASIRTLVDWRTGAMVLATVVVALVIAVVITGAQTTRAALDTRNQTALAATRRIDLLNERINELGSQLVAQAESNGERLGQLSEQVAALQEQVRQLGGEPVIVAAPYASSTSTTAAASSTTTSTTAASPPPESGGVCLGPICIGG